MTTKQRAYLKGLAMNMDAILQCGSIDDISPEFVMAIDEAIEKRELIKIHVLKKAYGADPKKLGAMMAERSRSELVQVIGNMVVLYRPAKEEKNRKIELPKEKKKK